MEMRSQLNSGVSRQRSSIMRRWPWWKVIVACTAYVVFVIAGTLWRLVTLADAEARRHGYAGEDLYILTPWPQVWWFALLGLPPLALIGWRVRAGRRRARAA